MRSGWFASMARRSGSGTRSSPAQPGPARRYLESPDSAKLCRIQTRVLHVRDTMAIELPDGTPFALVHKALISPLRERWKVDVENGPDLEVRGNIVDHEYEIESDGHKLNEVSKKWFRVRDTYGLEIAPAGHGAADRRERRFGRHGSS
jgi:uncharacterized protein YxjI